MGELVAISAVMALSGVLMWWLSARAASGALKRNNWAGVRVKSTMSSDAAWRVGHQAALPTARRCAIAIVAVCVIGVALGAATPANPYVLMLVVVTVSTAILLASCVVILRAANRAVAAMPDDEGPHGRHA